MTRFVTLVVCLVLASAGLGAANKEDSRLEDAGVVIEEILASDGARACQLDTTEAVRGLLIIMRLPLRS